MLRCAGFVIGLALAAPAAAHPMSRDAYSTRTAIELDGDTLQAVVVLEVPFDVVSADLRADMARAQASTEKVQAAQAVLDAYTHRHWERMARGLQLRVDGEVVPGTWRAKDNRLNGKGAVTGGFFLYIVEFVPTAAVPLDDDVSIVVENVAYADAPMVYSAMVVAGEGWKVTESSAWTALPTTTYNVDDPRFWVADPSLRRVRARFVRTP